MPAAEEVLDVDRVRGLLREQFPDLAARPLSLLANGWDNALMRLGDDLLVRLPRREPAARLVANEQRWLPQLAPSLPLPVPVAVRMGRPGPSYPWPWSITRYLPGTSAGRTTALDPHRAARTLATFLASLHVPAPTEAPVNPFRGVALSVREHLFEANLELAGAGIDATAARSSWRTAVHAPVWDGPPVWLHGDLHPENILVAGGDVIAVIDFGDITSGDPATDLAVVWMLLPPADRAAFWDSYAAHAAHPVDDALKVRTRGWALAFATVFLAHSADNPVLSKIGLHTATAVLESDES